jgi:hypothetical protein
MRSAVTISAMLLVAIGCDSSPPPAPTQSATVNREIVRKIVHEVLDEQAARQESIAETERNRLATAEIESQRISEAEDRNREERQLILAWLLLSNSDRFHAERAVSSLKEKGLWIPRVQLRAAINSGPVLLPNLLEAAASRSHDQDVRCEVLGLSDADKVQLAAQFDAPEIARMCAAAKVISDPDATITSEHIKAAQQYWPVRRALEKRIANMSPDTKSRALMQIAEVRLSAKRHDAVNPLYTDEAMRKLGEEADAIRARRENK